MLVKVCGMRDPENIRAVDGLGPDLMGFIFYEKSPRAVTSVPDYLPEHAERVGVFVNHDIDFILDKAKQFGLKWIQLHGQETPDMCCKLRRKHNFKVIKAFSIATAADVAQSFVYTDCCDLFIFDTKTPSVGGSGVQFDWSLLDAYHGPVKFLLSGGIGPDTDVSCMKHQMLEGYDLNSKFETEPGLKNIKALDSFIGNIKRNEQNR